MTTQMMPRLHVGDGWRAGTLTLFPVWVEGPTVHGLSVGTGGVEVAERDGAPVVGELVLSNTSDRPVLLFEGELLEGGWQHRVLNADLLLGVGKAQVAEVSCVEQGRWSGTARHARRARLASGSVRLGLRGHPSGRQSDVWRRVSRFEPALGPTPTFSLADHLDRVGSGTDAAGHPMGRGDASHVPTRPLSGQRGVIVGLGGRPAWLEILPTARALAEYWTALVDAALLDGQLAIRRATPGQAARDFAATCRSLPLGRVGLAGAAIAVAGSRGSLTARGVAAAQAQLLHVLAFDRDHRVWED